MRFYLLVPVFVLLNFFPLLSDQPDTLLFTDHVFSNKIKTVQLYKEGWNLSYPIIRSDSDEKLILHFDLLGDKTETYYYTFIHCDKDWRKSDIFPNDYLEGFPENQIEEYKTSFNTTATISIIASPFQTTGSTLDYQAIIFYWFILSIILKIRSFQSVL